VGTPLKAAVLVTDGYLDLEFWFPVLRLREAEAEVSIVAPSADRTVYSCLHYPVIADTSLAAAGTDFDLVVVPGGDAGRALAADPEATRLVASAARAGARVVAIGSGSQLVRAAQVAAAASCDDAEGLPLLFRQLLAPAGQG
jgi:deglycase